LLLVAFLLVNAPNCHLSLVLASAVQGDAVNCNKWHQISTLLHKCCLNNYALKQLMALLNKILWSAQSFIMDILSIVSIHGAPD